MKFLAKERDKKGHKSLLRLKFYLTGLFFWGFMLANKFQITGTIVDEILFFVGMASAIPAPLIRCENCGVLAYRVTERDHGLPRLDCFRQPKHCPGCGIERY